MHPYLESLLYLIKETAASRCQTPPGSRRPAPARAAAAEPPRARALGSAARAAARAPRRAHQRRARPSTAIGHVRPAETASTPRPALRHATSSRPPVAKTDETKARRPFPTRCRAPDERPPTAHAPTRCHHAAAHHASFPVSVTPRIHLATHIPAPRPLRRSVAPKWWA